MDLSHLRRESRTALELAVVAMAPSALVDRLAAVAGLLEALGELPTDSAPVIAIVPRVVTDARSALEDWKGWHDEYLEKKIAPIELPNADEVAKLRRMCLAAQITSEVQAKWLNKSEAESFEQMPRENVLKAIAHCEAKIAALQSDSTVAAPEENASAI